MVASLPVLTLMEYILALATGGKGKPSSSCGVPDGTKKRLAVLGLDQDGKDVNNG